MVAALAVGGWVAAFAAAALALAARRALADRIDRVGRAAHELRGGIGAARLGLAGEVGPSRLRAVELELDRAALALDDLDGPRRAWTWEYVDVEALLADSVEASRAAATVNSAELRLRWSGGRAVVLCDRVRVAQAACNLIANAIEHGGGTVEVRGSYGGDAVRLEVIDDGPGLPAPVADLIRRRAPRRRRGRGLGIAAEIASGHGGRLSSAPTVHGARVVLELPAAHRPARGSGTHP